MPSPTPPLRRWSTDSAPAGERMDYWIEAVCECFLEMHVESAVPDHFAAELVSAPLGALQINRVRGSPQDVYRTPRALARSKQDYYYLLCKDDIPWSAAQGSRRARLLPGDLLLIDSRHCYEFHFDQTCNTLSIELPTAWVEQWLPDPARICGRRLNGQEGFGAALSAFARALLPEMALAPSAPAALLTDQLGALLALASGGEAPRASEGASLHARIEASIRVPLPGECLNDMVPPHYKGLFDAVAAGNGNAVMLPFEIWREAFINDADLELAQAAYAKLNPHPYRTFTEPIALEQPLAALTVGKSYLNCVLDTALPASMPWHPRLSERLGLFRYVECAGSHEAWFTQPVALAGAIIEAGRD